MASDRSSTTPPAAPKSKQERIRDNQRRSRARRQEYLADLERRLKDCHTACREADLQRTAFADLQAENARLRDLLDYAGISFDVLHGFGRQSMASQTSRSSTVAHRQIKPKYQPTIPRPTPMLIPTMKRESTQSSDDTSVSSHINPLNTASTDSSSFSADQQAVPYSNAATTTGMGMSISADLSPSAAYPWMMNPGMQGSAQSDNVSFRSDIYLIPPQGQVLSDSGNSVQCSVTKVMIDQYENQRPEMDEMKSRMTTGYSGPRYTEQGYRVDTQLMFGMQDMNSAIAHG